MNFQEAESYLYSLGNEVETMKLGLENITTLLDALGQPHNSYKKVQVAGTNGKGSVCAFLDSICREAGIRTGLYTSPHLVSITERVRIDGSEIDEDEFSRLATRVRETSESLVVAGKLSYTPTFFEQITAIGLLAFAEGSVELAILETGLGGRYDAVTAAYAEIAAITRIALDHQEYLGETIEEIAAEKAAIIHAGSSVVALHQTPSVERVISGRCREVGVEPDWASTSIQIRKDRDIAPWQEATIVTSIRPYPNILFMGMMGNHQIENATIAVGIAEKLREIGYRMKTEDVVAGLEKTKHPGRLERIGHFLLDGAHNPAGAKALAAFLDEFFRDRPITIIFGAMKDKDLCEMAATLFPLAEQLILTGVGNSRSASTGDLLKYVAGRSNVNCAENVTRALEIAEGFPDNLVCVTGSLYLVGEARNILLQR